MQPIEPYVIHNDVAHTILQYLYDHEINFKIGCFWDAGFTWFLGDSLNGYLGTGTAKTYGESLEQLFEAAMAIYDGLKPAILRRINPDML